jgi:hypothetical protein
MHMDVLHRDLLLAFAAVAIERVEQHRIGARELVGLVQVLTPAFKRLFIDHGAPVTFHRGIMRRNELCRDHSFNLMPSCRREVSPFHQRKTAKIISAAAILAHICAYRQARANRPAKKTGATTDVAASSDVAVGVVGRLSTH